MCEFDIAPKFEATKAINLIEYSEPKRLLLLILEDLIES